MCSGSSSNRRRTIVVPGAGTSQGKAAARAEVAEAATALAAAISVAAAEAQVVAAVTAFMQITSDLLVKNRVTASKKRANVWRRPSGHPV